MMVHIFEPPVRRWSCPLCSATSVTRESEPHSRFHACHALGGLTSPMLPEGTDARVTLTEREDYVGSEDVQYHEGRPVSAVVTEYGDGRTDVAVYAPTARTSGDAS